MVFFASSSNPASSCQLPCATWLPLSGKGFHDGQSAPSWCCHNWTRSIQWRASQKGNILSFLFYEPSHLQRKIVIEPVMENISTTWFLQETLRLKNLVHVGTDENLRQKEQITRLEKLAENAIVRIQVSDFLWLP